MQEQLLGDLDSNLWIIMSHPKAADKTGPMSSSTGQLFMESVINSGLSRSQVRFEYLVNEIGRAHV